MIEPEHKRALIEAMRHRLLTYQGVKDAQLVYQGDDETSLVAYYVADQDIPPSLLTAHLASEYPADCLPQSFVRLQTLVQGGAGCAQSSDVALNTVEAILHVLESHASLRPEVLSSDDHHESPLHLSRQDWAQVMAYNKQGAGCESPLQVRIQSLGLQDALDIAFDPKSKQVSAQYDKQKVMAALEGKSPEALQRLGDFLEQTLKLKEQSGSHFMKDVASLAKAQGMVQDVRVDYTPKPGDDVRFRR
jgi:hypothetical protein